MNAKILFVDDEPAVLEGISNVLRKENFTVLTAESSHEALQILSIENIDIVVTDECMPGMKGHELLALISQDYPQTIRILLTGQASMEAVINAINKGEVYRFLSKPYQAKELAITLRDALEFKSQKCKLDLIHKNSLIENVTDDYKSLAFSGKEDVSGLLNKLVGIKNSTNHHLSVLKTESEKLHQAFLDDIKTALLKNQFELHYQPQFSLQDGQLVGMEALLRWNHPDKGQISAALFIPQLEPYDLMLELDEWVLKEACQQCKKWLDQGHDVKSMAINLSAPILQKKEFISIMAKILLETKVQSESIELEITEGVVMEQVESNIEALNRLREMGLKLAIDDFGTGYSSLGYLKHFPVQKLKIDKIFIDDLVTDNSDQILVKMIVELAQNLDLKLVVEGVETQQQAELLRSWGVDHVQGYLFSKPISAIAMEAMLSCSEIPPTSKQFLQKIL